MFQIQKTMSSKTIDDRAIAFYIPCFEHFSATIEYFLQFINAYALSFLNLLLNYIWARDNRFFLMYLYHGFKLIHTKAQLSHTWFEELSKTIILH